MKLTFLFSVLAISCAGNVLAADALPAEVKTFIERRNVCDHFRGEEPYDEERRAFIQKNIKESCTGTDKELAQLKRKYKKNKQVQKKLNGYEVSIEK